MRNLPLNVIAGRIAGLMSIGCKAAGLSHRPEIDDGAPIVVSLKDVFVTIGNDGITVECLSDDMETMRRLSRVSLTGHVDAAKIAVLHVVVNSVSRAIEDAA